uniref:Uncharacterized protein n=1 Tax=Zea mays TaxID=4577 RepID=C0P4G7_MAIZE|nr:unknown [Zea mays]|eukprot:NP_001168343.1 uncharacterized protein LOC100382111 [Zea mays]
MDGWMDGWMDAQEVLAAISIRGRGHGRDGGGGAWPVVGDVVELAVSPERVRLLAMDGVVADLELVLGHAQRDDGVDGDADDGGDGHVPSDDEERARQLLAELRAVAVEGALGVGDRQEERAQGGVGEEPREQAAQEPRHAVRVDDAQRVVHVLQQPGPLVQDHHRVPRHAAGQHAHHHGRPPLHQPCGGRDADESGDHALDGAHDGGLLEEDDVEAGPDEEAHGGADVGVEHRHGRHHVGGVRPAAVEAGPPHPQQARAGEREQDVVRREPLPVLLRPGPHPVGCREPGEASGEVDDVAAAVVDDAPLEEEPAAPYGEGADGVGEGEPERHEQHPRGEAHPAQQRPGDQHQGDGREHALEVHHRGHRVQRLRGRGLQGAAGEVVRRGGEAGLPHQPALAQRRPRLAPQRQQPVAEGHVVGPGHPADPHRRERVQRHEGRVHGPLLLHHAAVQDHQTREALQPHQRRRRQLPRVVALVQPLGRRRRRLVRQRHRRPGRRRHVS